MGIEERDSGKVRVRRQDRMRMEAMKVSRQRKREERREERKTS